MRTVVVTGAATGIGLATARVFHSGGDRVVLTGRRKDVLDAAVAGLGDRATALPFDATDPAQVESALDQLPAQVDVLVNNAGGNTDFDREPPSTLAETAEAWRANLDANLLSAVLVTTALRERLAPGGAVVNIGSIAADQGSGAYGAAKAALASWTVDLATQLGPQDVTVNTVAPGFVADTEFFRGMLPDEYRQSFVDAALTGRAGSPDDVAGTIGFLAGPAARHVTGQSLAVNGGTRTTR
ncbi:SDR family oxidoreductase [Pseudonocardia sp. NPDC046786]|uniref:SDR family NAD(P)-dependent oxidoreductase n=1 Tax=Pseudonocardia sp. NPDC046786 TaxID=3155471 RepID=UPI0033BFEFCD